ncbi:nucleotidyltransferase domain-containing protein [Pseudomonas sp. NPDC007930]|uniref:type VII toxin-antitoxin system MntA family adenylyltransferase antitoxin n=1 Tax=Pseudomonas sp. NPDC007930 TaxID=3364417 RepID=UPI0036E6DD63
MDLSPLLAQLEQQLPHWLAIYLYGSHARGEAGAGSDLDLAVLADGPPLDTLRLWDLGEQLAALAGCDVDLVDLKAASVVMRYQIVAHGRCLKARQPAAHLFEARVVQDKLDLDELRREQVADILQRGSVHGR